MYCSSCGMAVTQGLSYCNHCGAKLSGAKGDDLSVSSGVKPGLLVSAMAVVFIFGLGAIAVLIGVLKAVARFDFPILLAVTIFCLALILVVEGVLIGLLLTGKRVAEETGDTERLKEQTTKELGVAQARVLSEPVPSITEHTTRSFDPVYSERRSK
jgi:phosphate/sulfate permease